jgi:NYN domain
VWVGKTEEKGSDVNLASHLVRDALTNRFEAAVVLSNDTDLVEPIRIAVKEAQKSVILLSPLHPNPKPDPATGRKPSPAKSLRDVASSVLHIRNSHLRRAQFPDRIPRAGKTDIVKLPNWV